MNKFIFSILTLVFAAIFYQSHLEKSRNFNHRPQEIKSPLISEAKAESKIPEIKVSENKIIEAHDKDKLELNKASNKEIVKVASIKPKANNINSRASLKSLPNTIIYFEESKSEIKDAELVKLDSLITKTLSKPILLFAYNDSLGTSVQNKKLSSERIKSVESYLKSKGISLEIKSHVFDSSNSLESNKTAIGRANNRRIEIFTDY